MGKRKERRLAAKLGAGRRFKLDLFAEPSVLGDLGHSSAQDEVGKDVDAKLDAELPNSPSSSGGQQVENPLSLLGQYSDDELDEGSKETTSAPNDSLEGDDSQTKLSVGKPVDEGGVDTTDNLPLQKANSDLEKGSPSPSAPLAEAGGAMSNMVALDDTHNEGDVDNLGTVHEVSETQTAVGISSNWEMVLHEESNRYYYWNTVTGETSWELPEALTQGIGLANKFKDLGPEKIEGAAGDINVSAAAFGAKLDDYSTSGREGYLNGVLDVSGMYEHAPDANQSVDQCKVDGSQFMGVAVGVLPYETSTLGNHLCNQLSGEGGNLSSGNNVVHGHSTMINEQGAIDLPLDLIKHAESLLERLKLLQRSGSEQQGWISKFFLEVEIRLSDLRSLLPHGSSLAPFWLHSERQLNQLQDAINTEIGEGNNEISSMDSVGGEKTKLDEGGGSTANAQRLHDVDASVSLDEASDSGIIHLRQAPVHDCSREEGGQETNRASQDRKLSSKPELESDEDVDMDIDMDLEDSIPARSRTSSDMGGQLVTPSEQLIQETIPTEGQSPPEPGEFIPPPPEEEWVPPPPPDNDGIPPPPPDEPPESCPPPPPSEPESLQSIYSEQYNLPYAGSNVNYYDSSQMAVLNPPVYYATQMDVLPTAAPNPADSVLYYGLQNGAIPVVSVGATVDTLGFQSASGHLNYDQLPQIATVGASAEASSVLDQPVNALAPGSDVVVTSSEASSSSVVSAPATVSVKEYVSVPTFSAAVSSVTATSTSGEASASLSKAQPKAARMKKPKVAVGSSLRSNKKVSSLVDKWKAAKEELQEEEEEVRETPLEILEKKRQREIQGWRAQQIASGEAKENANFQPLGGDWRERVKRRRAQKEATVEKSSDAADNGTNQPDLDELSRDLPPGWQAYWDDSSKQVYYANSVTSKTTWTKPTR